MAFNVCNKEGKHIGVTFGKGWPLDTYRIGQKNRRVTYVALTDQRIEDWDMDYEKLEKQVAERHSAKNLFGRIKEEALQKELKNYWEEEKARMKSAEKEGENIYQELKEETQGEGYRYLYRDFQPSEFDPNFIYRLYHLKNRLDLKSYWLGGELDIKGFVMYDLEKGVLYDEKTLLLEEPLDYIETEEEYQGLKPIHCVIAHRPEVKIVGMGVGEGLLLGASIGDLGGRNHVHYTKVNLLSGNALFPMEAMIHIHGKKGQSLTMYVDQEKNNPVAFICDGVLYTA